MKNTHNNKRNRTVYKVLNDRKSWIGTLYITQFEKQFVVQDSLVIARIEDKTAAAPDKKGGLLIFAADAHAGEVDTFVKCIKKVYYQWKQGLPPFSEVKKPTLSQWTIGNFFTKSYTADTGAVFNEKSMGIEITALDFTELMDIAESLCDACKQETLLLMEYTQNKILALSYKPQQKEQSV